MTPGMPSYRSSAAHLAILQALAIITNASSSASAHSQRLEIPFSYAWRFHYGDAAGGGDGPWGGQGFDAFEALPLDALCTNSDGSALEHNPNRFNEWDCQIACLYSNIVGDDESDSDPTDKCMVWQQTGRYCYHSVDPNVTCTAPDDDGEHEHLSDYEHVTGGVRPRSAALPLKKDYDFATVDLDDDAWPLVDAPHDFSIENGTFDPANDFKHGYLPRTTSWYRKHFKLPVEFDKETSHLELHFQGCFHVCSIWLNGEFLALHTAGYTGFTVRLDNSSALLWPESDGDAENVLAIRADASFGSGHWYEGGGLYREVTLVKTDPSARFPMHGVFVAPELAGQEDSTSKGVTIPAWVEVELAAGSNAYVVHTTVLDPTDGGLVAEQNATVACDAASPTTSNIGMTLKVVDGIDIRWWSVQDPFLYTVKTSLYLASDPTQVFDEHETSTGFRATAWDNTGFYLNDELLTLRGFSHHSSLAGIGTALSPRINLFKVQASKALGANTWRMSHNPYTDSLYKILDITGQLVWDESRDFGYEYRMQMHDLVKSHREHTSVMIWSYGNEYELQQVAQNMTNMAYRDIALAADPTRPTTENDMTLKTWYDIHVDVKGWSHVANATFETFRESYPDVPQVLSECCSCNSQRAGYNGDRTIDPCIWEQNSPLQLPYVAGSLGVWTLFDYFGEPGIPNEDVGWPEVSSSFGQFDLAGFPKPHAFWYRTNWLSARNEANLGYADPGLPACDVPVGTARVLGLLDDLNFTAVNSTHTAASIGALANGAKAEMFVNGQTAGALDTQVGEYPETVEPLLWQVVRPIENSDGTFDVLNATLVVYAADGDETARHEVIGRPADAPVLGLVLALDVPSAGTGTGGALVLDGEDTAMLHASLVDTRTQALVSTSEPANVTFEVVSGPGRLRGVGNGDPNDHTLPAGDTVPTFAGNARAFVQVNVDATRAHRDLIGQIDVDGGGRTEVVVGDCAASGLAVPIAVRATAVVGETAMVSEVISIPISCSVDDDGWEAAARATATNGSFTYMEAFAG